MKVPLNVRCLVCFDVFCCPGCRRIHEEKAHAIKYDCPICRDEKLPCSSGLLRDRFLLDHIKQSHLPLHCGRCNQVFEDMDDLSSGAAKCLRDEVSEPGDSIEGAAVDGSDTLDRFDQLYERSENYSEKEDTFDEISSVAGTTFTPCSNLDSQGSEEANGPYVISEQKNSDGKSKTSTPIVRNTLLALGDRRDTPYVKKKLIRQMAAEMEDSSEVDVDCDTDEAESSTEHCLTLGQAPESLDEMNSKTPSRIEQSSVSASVTPATLPSRRYATTSTPTHPAAAAWTLFPSAGNDSPLSEIDSTTASPATASTDNEAQTPTDSVTAADAAPRPLKSIMLASGRAQDSAEKQVTFAGDAESTASELSSVRSKKVKFADDTNFDRNKHFNRVFRKPRRYLTPGPTKFIKNSKNPRFQAIINQFESGVTKQKAPPTNESDAPDDVTPNIAGINANPPPRAIVFNESDNLTSETSLPLALSLVSPFNDKPIPVTITSPEDDDALFKSCMAESPFEEQENKENSLQAAISAFSNNVACSIQKSLSAALQTGAGESTKIQFNFIITKKTVTVRRIHDSGNDEVVKSDEVVRDENVIARNDGEGIWTSIRRAVNNVIWGKSDSPENKERLCFKTPEADSVSLVSSDLSSGSKRKCSALGDLEQSPLNHKRCKHAYAGRIRGRRPLEHSLARAASAGQHGFFKMLNKKKIERTKLNRSF